MDILKKLFLIKNRKIKINYMYANISIIDNYLPFLLIVFLLIVLLKIDFLIT